MASLTVLYTVPVHAHNGVQTGRSCKFQTLLKRHGKEKKICLPFTGTQQKSVIMWINVHSAVGILGFLFPEVIKSFFCCFIAHLQDDFPFLSDSLEEEFPQQQRICLIYDCGRNVKGGRAPALSLLASAHRFLSTRHASLPQGKGWRFLALANSQVGSGTAGRSQR